MGHSIFEDLTILLQQLTIKLRLCLSDDLIKRIPIDEGWFNAGVRVQVEMEHYFSGNQRNYPISLFLRPVWVANIGTRQVDDQLLYAINSWTGLASIYCNSGLGS